MDSSDGPNINGKCCMPMDTLEEPLNNKGGSDGVKQDELESTNTLEKPLNNKGGSDEVNQDEAEPVILNLFPPTPDLQPWKISEESSIIVTPSGIPTAGQSSTQAAGNSPLNLENRSAQHRPSARNRNRNIGVDRSRCAVDRWNRCVATCIGSCGRSTAMTRHPRNRR